MKRSLLLLGALIVLSGCGGGGGGVSSQNSVTPLASTEENLGPEGGSVSLPEFNLTASVPNGALTSNQPVKMAVYDENGFPVKLLTTPGDNPISIEIDTNALSQSGEIQVTAPLGGLTDTEDFFVALSSSKGFALPLDVTVDSVNDRFSFAISKKDMDSLKQGDGATPKILWATLVHPVPAPVSASASGPYGRVFLWQGKGSASSIQNHASREERWGNTIDVEWINLVQAGRLAIVTHGMRNTISNMDQLAFYLYSVKGSNNQNVYSNVIGFDYDWWDNIRDNGNRLAKTIAKLHERFPQLKIDVYGHSMGGLVARWAIEKGELSTFGGIKGVGAYVDRLFTLGTPHFGVTQKAIQAFGLNIPAAELALMGISRAAFFVLSGVKDLIRERQFIQWLNDGGTSQNGRPASYTAFAGVNSSNYGPIGKAVQFAYAEESPEDIPFDGIVPLRSAQYSFLSSLCPDVRRPPAVADFNHSQVRGEYQNQNGWDINFQHRFMYEQGLRPYILELAGTGVGIK